MRRSLSLILPLLLLVTRAAAHGYVKTFTADGTTYYGNDVDNDQKKASSSIFKVAGNGPVIGATNPSIACGNSPVRASKDATVTAGSTITIHWSDWPHEEGPIENYLTSCGESCKDFDYKSAKWLKFHQSGVKDSGEWVQKDIQGGEPYKLPIPKDLKPGDYLLRHEIIALHNAQAEGGAEFYPQCIWLTVKGSGSAVPPAAKLVSFPGAYQADDPGILVNIYTNFKAKNYVFPGGDVVDLGGGDEVPENGGNDNKDNTKDNTKDDSNDNSKDNSKDDNPDNKDDNTDDPPSSQPTKDGTDPEEPPKTTTTPPAESHPDDSNGKPAATKPKSGQCVRTAPHRRRAAANLRLRMFKPAA